MWQTDWAENTQSIARSKPENLSLLAPAAVDAVYLLHWREHCLECAQPDCYKVCPLYVQRRDRRCARFQNGILPNPLYAGLYPYGAEIRYRRWGVLESTFGFGAVSPRAARRFDSVDRFLTKSIRAVSSLARRISPNYRLSRAYGILRERLLAVFTRRRRAAFDEFAIEVWNAQPEPVRLVIECQQDGPKFRASVLAEPGRTMHHIPVQSMHIDLYGRPGVVRVYPENDAPAHVIFTWLDFVRYAGVRKRSPAALAAQPAHPAPKVKCVVWDLDNTVWDGVLGEQEPERVALRPGVRETMLALDSRGILQSIASKNDRDDAWRVLERLGVSELFLYPAIDWQPKSANIRRIVQELNLGADACALVDDSAFERAEVASQLPEMRVYSDTDVAGLLERPEFEVAVTEESRQRRWFYVAESGRKQAAAGYQGDYEAFLGTCNMEARLFAPSQAAHIERSLEVLQRTNQLNLTTHRYTREEFDRLLDDGNSICICTSCRDRFGEYGLVGFASLRRQSESLELVDFVMSCRVAQKKVENAWFGWLVREARAAGYGKICARYVKTARNRVLLDTFLEVGFVETEKHDQYSLLELDCAATPPLSGLVAIDAAALRGALSAVMTPG
jgi:FkbH-like protein